jgi:parallel beta-helix repeat protein
MGIGVFKRTVASFIIMLLLVSSFAFLLQIHPAKAAGTIYIRANGSIDPPTAPISTLDMVTYAFTGDIFDQTVVVERNNIIIDGAGHTMTGTKVAQSKGMSLSGRTNVTITNLTIQCFYNGIYLSYSTNCNVSGNDVANNDWAGVYFAGGSGNTVSGNNITNNGYYGVYLYSSSNTVSGNNITNNHEGVRICYTPGNNTVSGNNVTTNILDGITVAYSNNNSISRNNITANLERGIFLWDCGSNSLSGNTFTDDGLYVDNSFTNSVESNTVNGKPLVYLESVSDYAVADAGQVVLVNCSRIKVENLNLSRTCIGVQLLETDNTIISRNILGNNKFAGIMLDSSSNNSINGNNLTGNMGGGLWLWYFCNNSISRNKMANNNYGVYLYYYCNNNSLSRNDIAANKHDGIWFDSYTYNNCVTENNITANKEYGIELFSASSEGASSEGKSSSNNFYHNNFVQNTRQVLCEPYANANTWDDGYPSGGNYWSDYIGSDADGDGIGDTPYVIDANNTDHYPLMNPWTPTIADSFRFPLDGPWTVSQRFGGYNYDWNGYHLGEDVLRSYEAPVYAPADGVVKQNAKRTGYGYVAIIEHELLDGTFVCSVLGHLREAGRIPVGTRVTKGQIVGYLSSVPEENGGIIHLHFGIRKGAYSEELDFDGKWRYRGYGPIDIVGSWFSPSAFIEYYNENNEMPPSYSLTINTEESGAFAATGSTSVCLLTFKTQLSLIATHPWFQRWSGTDNDNVNPTTVIMDRIRGVIQWLLSEPPPPCPTPWELAIELANEKAEYGLGGGNGWNHTMIWEGDPPKLIYHGWGTPKDHPLIVKKWLEANEIKEGYYLYNDTTGKVEFGKGVDCSGLVFWAYNKAWGARPEAMLTKIEPESKRENINPILYVGAWTQYWCNCLDITKDQLQAGDLLFFDTDDPRDLDPDHVAMYVGGPFQYSYGDGETFTYNVVESTYWGDKIVTVAFYDSATENMSTLQPSTGNLRDPPLPVKYYGRPLHQMDNKPLSFTCGSPVDLMVTDPDGIVLTKEVGEIAGMSYTEFDLDGDGELDDKVEVWEPKVGNYLVTVIPEPGAPPTGNFTLEASANGTTILLADYAQISEIPTDPYIITRNETAIVLRNTNIAATNVTQSKNVVGQGYSSSISVTVQNQGNLEETFNVTLYVNTTIIASQAVTLTNGNSSIITFAWNTSTQVYGNYTINAYAWPVLGETYTADNNLTGGTVKLTIAGDINGDFTVDIYDAILLAGHFNQNPSNTLWNANSDINSDNIVDIYDAIILANHYNQHYP